MPAGDEWAAVRRLLAEPPSGEHVVQQGRDRLMALAGADLAAPGWAKPGRPGRRRRVLLRVGLPLTAVTAALTAIAVVAAGTGAPRATTGKPHAAPAPAPGFSLRTRLLAAFAAAGGEVLHMHSTWITGSSASAEQDTWVAPWDAQPGQVQRQRTVIRMATGNPYVLNANSNQDIEMIYTVPASGLSTPSKSESPGVKSNVEGQVIDVEDTARTWSDQPRTPIVIAPAIDDPGQLRGEIAAGDFTVVRHTAVGGQPALELRRIIESPADAGSEGNTAVSYLWVSTSTYLPLKSAFISTQGTAATGHIASDDIVTYEFLPATPANLAKLRPVIPAGFTRTAKPPVNLHG